MSQITPSQPSAPGVQRQITLPLSKAVEIAYKSIRLRLSRSLLVTSGIVLALAFLVSIQTSEAVVEATRGGGGREGGEETDITWQRVVYTMKDKTLERKAL